MIVLTSPTPPKGQLAEAAMQGLDTYSQPENHPGTELVRRHDLKHIRLKCAQMPGTLPYSASGMLTVKL